MHARFARKVGANGPIVGDGVLYTRSRVQRVRRVVMRVDESRFRRAVLETAVIHRLKSSYPSRLSEIVEIQTHARSNHGSFGGPEGLRDAQPGCERFPVIVWNPI